MPLFRFHRRNLDESLETTVIVKDMTELRKVIKESYKNWEPPNIENFELIIFPYIDENNNFDGRIGWYTQMVTCDAVEKGKFVPEGFLSEPL